MYIKYKINNAVDREKLIIGFANSGYKVHVEEEKEGYTTVYYVLVENNPKSAHQAYKEQKYAPIINDTASIKPSLPVSTYVSGTIIMDDSN